MDSILPRKITNPRKRTKRLPKIKQKFRKPTAEDLTKCYYIPFTTVEKVLKYVEPYSENTHYKNHSLCTSHLAFLQSEKCGTQHKYGLEVRSWRTLYALAMRDAIYKHDWNKVAYMMARTPMMEHYFLCEFGIYPKLLAILLMFHPYAKTHKLLDEYLHMVLACHNSEEKMAAMKIINTLPPKLLKPRKSFCDP